MSLGLFFPFFFSFRIQYAMHLIFTRHQKRKDDKKALQQQRTQHVEFIWNFIAKYILFRKIGIITGSLTTNAMTRACSIYVKKWLWNLVLLKATQKKKTKMNFGFVLLSLWCILSFVDFVVVFTSIFFFIYCNLFSMITWCHYHIAYRTSIEPNSFFFRLQQHFNFFMFDVIWDRRRMRGEHIPVVTFN